MLVIGEGSINSNVFNTSMIGFETQQELLREKISPQRALEKAIKRELGLWN